MKKIAILALLFAAGVARADGLQTYVADDLHPLESATQNALTARAALSNETAAVLVVDGQVPLLNDKAELVSDAQKKGVHYYVCDTDMRAFKSPTLPEGVEVVDTEADTHDTPRSTVSRILARICRHGGA
jgi:intracellular sulfur oxidation DsrE/DsrF family protein